MLNEMKEAGRSEHPGSVVKKRGSSGCLIIKKKVTDSVRGASDSSSRNLFKKKKRRRVSGSDSESIDNQSEATIGHKSDKLHNGPVVYLEDGEFGNEKRVSKCNGLDVFEFDEYDGFDESRIRKDANANDGSRYRWKLNRPTEMSAGSDFHYDLNKRSSSMFATDSSRPRPEMEDDDESDLPLSVLSKKYRLSSNKPIRLQGKNGVLKVMVNNNKQMGVSRTSSDQKEATPTPTPTPRVMQNKKLNVSVKSSDQNRDAEDTKFCVKPAKSKRKDTVMQLKSCSRGGKVVKKEGIIRENENGKGKESKVKRGSGTEKQILREKIKKMLFGAGWSIDYRPRRNRDYMDAVYISPAGTAYWSIIKAYDALQKEEEDNSSKAGGNFTPLADEILGKLTRQTRKKMEREMKKKRKLNEEADDSDREEEKLNSYSRKSSLKKRRLDQNSDDDDSSYDDEIPKNDRAANSDGRKSGRCTLLVRSSSDKGPYSENEGYSGKRTLLSWLIDSQVVQMSEHVQYMNRRKTRIMQKGWITKEGIHCGCCSKIVPVSKFEVHAGSKVGQPYPNIYLESGKSLMQCQIDAWNKQGELEQKGFYSVDVEGGDDDPNDDTCGLCGDGGDLICCDGCPSTFHQSCLDIQMLPLGDWHCPNCCCKYCEINGGNCDKNEAPLLVCCFCQKKYHESCRPEKDLKPIDLNLLFCEHKCQKLHSELQKLFGVKHELDSGFSWSLIHRSDILTDASSSSVQLSRRVECNSMLAVAMSVMDECFLPISDKRTGNNLIRNVVFNCGGFFTAILERGDEIVCAASIRIHGTQLAEMPFIGTRHIYRRQGMCRRLLSAIESALSSLEVETLIIPAIAEHMHTWTDVFGFHSLEESHKQEMRSMNMLVFPGTDMLQKPLLINRIAQGNKTAAGSEEESCVLLKDGCSMPVNKSELVSSSSCGQFSQPDPSCKTADVDSHPPQAPDVAASHATDILCEPQLQLPVSFDSNVEESSIRTQLPAGGLVSSVVSCDPQLQVPGKESVSVHDPVIKEIAGKESDHVHDPNAEEIDGKESVPVHDPAVEEIAGKESVSVHDPNVEEIDGKESVSVHDSDAEEIDGKESVSVHDSALEEIAGKESVSVHDPNAEEIDGKESVSIHDSALEEIAGKESVSVHDPNVEEIDGKESVSVHDSALEEIDGKESVSVHDPNAEEIAGKESVSVHDPNAEEMAGKESVSVHNPAVEEIGVQNGDGTNLLLTQVRDDKVPTDTLFKSDLQVQVHLEKVDEIYVQNGCETSNNTTDVISIEDQAPNAPSNSTISCEHEQHCSGKHGVKEDMIQISEGSCETEMNTKEKGKSSNL